METYKIKDGLLGAMCRMDEEISLNGATQQKSFKKLNNIQLNRLMEGIASDGYIEEHQFTTKRTEKQIPLGYYISQKGIDFINHGGYTKQYQIMKRKEKAEQMNDNLTIYGKPITIFLGTLLSLYGLYSIVNDIFFAN